MPTTPGIKWEKNGNYFIKNTMRSDVSFVSLQWLYYIQATAPYLTKQDGTRAVIEHGYHHGEIHLDGIGKIYFIHKYVYIHVYIRIYTRIYTCIYTFLYIF